MAHTRIFKDDPALQRLLGPIDGPIRYIPSLDLEVPTYIDRREKLVQAQARKFGTLMYHVPIHMRGPYRLEPDSWEKPAQLAENPYVLCEGLTNAGEDCRLRALNRSGYCQNHGGGLHPADKLKKEDNTADKSRWMRFLAGDLDPLELTDEELARASIQDDDGRWRRMRSIPAKVHTRMMSELFKRSDEHLQHALLDVVQTMTEIAKGQAYEPQDRLAASKWIFERVRGKNPERIIHSQDEPWKVVFDGIGGGTRAESRRARGVEDGNAIEDGNTIDAEVIGEDAYVPELHIPDAEEVLDIQDVAYEDEEARLNEQYYEAKPHHIGPLGIPVDGPPLDPTNRDRWEVAQEAERLRVLKERADLAERLKLARRKRESARARGFNDIVPIPYEVKEKILPGTGLRKLTFHEGKPEFSAARKVKDAAVRQQRKENMR